MPFSLLEQLAREPCPNVLETTEDIHKLLSLSAAGLVAADIPVFHRGADGGGRYAGPATVSAVTSAGLAALKSRRKRKPQRPGAQE